MSIVTLTTDYGWQDHYVGAVKGAILSIAPDLTLVDITHDLPPYDIAAGAFVLWQTTRCYPIGAVHVAVVDPGVGSARRGLIGRYAGQTVVAPDNGTVSWIHRELKCEALRALENTRYFGREVSATFHGRDIFGPVAAHAACGVPLDEFGPAVRDPLLMPFAALADNDRSVAIRGRVIYADRFGNLVTNIHRKQLGAFVVEMGAWQARIGNVDIGPVRSTFGDVPAGSALAYIGSAELLEVAVNLGSALDTFGREAEVIVVHG